MDYISQRVDADEIKPGDHIYTWRTAFTYSHHGIYVVENKVIHFTAPQTANSGSGWNLCSSVPSACMNSSAQIGQYCDSGSPLITCECGIQQSEGGVIVSCLKCFIGTGSLYLYQYGVNKWSLVSKLRGGTCTTAQSDPAEDVVAKANYLLQEGFGEYNVVRNNCEDFALYCKTSLLVIGSPHTGSSGQVNSFLHIPWKTALFISRNPCSPWCAVAAGVEVGMICWNRYRNDIGVRNDAVKVKVEDVAYLRGLMADKKHDGNVVTETS